MNNAQSWNEIKSFLKPGSKLTGIVTKHSPFGFFVQLPGIQFRGLVEISDFKDEGMVTPLDYPEIGSSVEVVVIAFNEPGNQIWLSMKPSQFPK